MEELEKEIMQKIRDDSTNELELRKYTAKIKGRLSNDISSDYVLAKLDSADKEGIINAVGNAFMCKKLLIQNIFKGHYWKWDKKKEKWKKVFYASLIETKSQTGETITEHSSKTKDMLEKANVVFDRIILKADMTTIINRNVKDNPIMQMLNKWQQQDENGTETQNKVADIVEGKEK